MEIYNKTIVQIYHSLEDSNQDLMVIMVDLFDLLHTDHSDKRKIIDYIQKELRGYDKDLPVSQIPYYRKVLIDDFVFDQDSELLGIKKIIQRLEGRTIVINSLEELRTNCILEPIEENLYVQNKKYGWEMIEVRGEVNNLLGGTDKEKRYPKVVNDVILKKIEQGIRNTLKHRLKAYFPEIQQQIFDIKIDNMRYEIERLRKREKEFDQGLRVILWAQRTWVDLLCSKDPEYNWTICGICLSKRKANQLGERLYNFGKWFFANKARTITTILSSLGIGAFTYDEIASIVQQIIEYFGLF